MSITKLRGYTQIMDKSVRLAQMDDNLGLKTSQLADGAEFLKRDGSVAVTGDINLNSHKLTNVANGVVPTDAVNKSQLDSAIAGLPQPMTYAGKYKPSDPLPTTINQGEVFVIDGDGQFNGADIQNGAEIVAKSTKTTGVTAADFDIVNREDQVVTVAGKKGVVTLVSADITDLTASAAEINQIKGITGNVQTQLDAKLDDNQLITDATLQTAQDTNIASAKAVKVYADTQDAATLASAKAYTDAEEVKIRTDFAAADAATLASAKAYTDAEEVKIRTDFAAADATTLAAAKEYADTNIGAKLPVFVDDEALTGTIDGANRVFSITGTPVVGSVKLYYSGARLHGGVGNDYTIDGKNITVAVEHTPQPGDVLLADYRTN